MRLTLRTLLAYLDNVLEPADAAELGKKIEESEVAKALIRRIRELLRKDKLGAPEVLDHRESLDPNTVAEYLDNTLPAEKVADFEKVCLESDIELAEVAACHQILALVLGEPAEVAPALREKIYKLPQVAAQQESAVERIARDLTADVEGFPPAETQPTGASPIRPRAEAQFVSNVSERSYRRWLLGLSVLLILGFAVVGGLLVYRMSWPSPSQSETVLATKGPEAGLGESQPTSPTKPADSKATGSTESVNQPSQEEGVSSRPAAETPTGDTTEVRPATGASSPAPPDMPSETGQPVQQASPGVPVAEAPTASPQQPMMPPAELSAQPSPPPTDVAVSPQLPQSPRPPVGDLLPAPPPVPPAPSTSLPGGTIPDAVPPVDVAPLPPEPIGSLLPDPRLPQVLFLTLPNRPAQRVSPEQQVKTGDSFLVPPSFRPKLRLGETLEVECIGPVFWELAPVDAQGRVGLRVTYGNLAITATAPNGASLRLTCGPLEGILELNDQNTMVALAVQRNQDCAGDPETQPVPWVTDLYVLGGAARWLDSGRTRPLVLRAPVQVRLSESELQTAPLENQPEWIRPAAETAAIIEERAMAVLERALRDTEKDPLQVLRENSAVRQREVAWLARRSLAYLGVPDDLWKTLEDSDQRAYWRETWIILRQLVRISPTLAASVRRAAERVLVSDGAIGYAMLWRYPSTQLTLAQAEELIQYLDHEKLAIRVLASLMLRQVTQMTLTYEPQSSPTERRRAIELWRKRLKSGPVHGVVYEPAAEQP
ncbi:hypothetical protein [Thermogutta sp.]|uniref:hypothetical protein n=1 Tax=Thermogutta sp. TaxID=1962930 RepID=UPI003C7EB22E